jgi:hypothetical protein
VGKNLTPIFFIFYHSYLAIAHLFQKKILEAWPPPPQIGQLNEKKSEKYEKICIRTALIFWFRNQPCV